MVGFRLETAFGPLGLDLLDRLCLGDFLVAAAVRLIGRGGAELLAFGSDEFLLPVDLHLDVFLMLTVELCLLLLITQLTNEVFTVTDLLVLDLEA